MDFATAASIASIISSIGSNIAGMFGSRGDRDVERALAEQREYMRASVDPNHPWARALSAAIREQMQREAAQALMEEMRMRRRLIAAGNLPAGIDASRRDEARSQALAQAWMNAVVAAQQDAQQRLAQAAGMSAGAMPGLLKHAEMKQLGEDTRQQNMFKFFQNLPLVLNQVRGMFGKSQPSTYIPDVSLHGSGNWVPYTGRL